MRIMWTDAVVNGNNNTEDKHQRILDEMRTAEVPEKPPTADLRETRIKTRDVPLLKFM